MIELKHEDNENDNKHAPPPPPPPPPPLTSCTNCNTDGGQQDLNHEKTSPMQPQDHHQQQQQLQPQHFSVSLFDFPEFTQLDKCELKLVQEAALSALSDPELSIFREIGLATAASQVAQETVGISDSTLATTTNSTTSKSVVATAAGTPILPQFASHAQHVLLADIFGIDPVPAVVVAEEEPGQPKPVAAIVLSPEDVATLLQSEFANLSVLWDCDGATVTPATATEGSPTSSPSSSPSSPPPTLDPYFPSLSFNAPFAQQPSTMAQAAVETTKRTKRRRPIKKRKRSEDRCNLTYKKRLGQGGGPWARIRIWSNTKNMIFYDCECGSRKPVQDLNKIKLHAKRHDTKKPARKQTTRPASSSFTASSLSSPSSRPSPPPLSTTTAITTAAIATATPSVPGGPPFFVRSICTANVVNPFDCFSQSLISQPNGQLVTVPSIRPATEEGGDEVYELLEFN